jgi:magnesium-protoporphyrin O-methyltransferase
MTVLKSKTDDKTVVKDYFNSTGFERWRRIYGEAKVSKVQLDIRTGHQQTVDTVTSWLENDRNLSQITVCDAGCGVGSLSIPLAQAGTRVYASDISEKMVTEGKDRALAAIGHGNNPYFFIEDLEKLAGQYHTVICLDVLIHYPDAEIAQMIAHLCSLAETRLILSFAPKTRALSVLKKIGGFFPGASKATRAYLHAESSVVKILTDNGFQVKRTAMTKTRFYFSRLMEAVRIGLEA